MATGSVTGFRYSFQVTAIGVFKTVRPSMSVANYLRIAGAGSVELRPKIPADGFPTETFTVEDGHVITGSFIELVAADEGCFPIDVAGS
jgi:hypothetical protein